MSDPILFLVSTSSVGLYHLTKKGAVFTFCGRKALGLQIVRRANLPIDMTASYMCSQCTMNYDHG